MEHCRCHPCRVDHTGMSGYKGSPGWDGKNPYRYSGKFDDNAKTRSTGKSLEEILKMLNKEDVDGREGSKDPSSNEEC